MAEPVRNLLQIAQSIEEILEQYLRRRSLIKRLFNHRSDMRRLKKSQERLQELLGVLQAASLVENRIAMNIIEQHLVSLREMHSRQILQQSDAAQYMSSDLGINNDAPARTTQDQISSRGVPVDERGYAPRPITTYVQDNRVVVDGSSNNITMIISDSRQNV